MSPWEITQSIVQLEQELKDINNRIRNEPVATHYNMRDKVQTQLDSVRFQLSQSNEQANPIQAEILKLQAQILAIPTGFTGTGSAARREADNNINIRAKFQSQIEALKMQLQAPNKVILNNDISGPPTLPYFVPEPVISEQVQAPNKVIENNQIIGPPLVSGQTNKIPILPIVAGVGVLILIGALAKKRKR